MNHDEDDRDFTDAEPANRQRKQGNARQQVTDGYNQIVDRMKMFADYCEA
jgi:hypothetical protein